MLLLNIIAAKMDVGEGLTPSSCVLRLALELELPHIGCRGRSRTYNPPLQRRLRYCYATRQMVAGVGFEPTASRL